jgi:hypothetical protein
MRVAKPSAAQRNVKMPSPAVCNLKVESYRPGRTRFAYMMALYLFLQNSGGEVRFTPQEVPERGGIQGVLWPLSASLEDLIMLTYFRGYLVMPWRVKDRPTVLSCQCSDAHEPESWSKSRGD